MADDHDETKVAETVAERTVTLETLRRVVSSLANECPVRFWLNHRHDDYEHMAIDVWFPTADFPQRLHKELEEMGFTLIAGKADVYASQKDGCWIPWGFRRRWEARRDWEGLRHA